MNVYAKGVEDIPAFVCGKTRIVPDAESLHKAIAEEFCGLLEEKQRKNELLTIICPVGPLNYAHFANEVKRRGLHCRNLRTINMDEYLDENDTFIPYEHPLSFRRFMEKTFFSHLPKQDRPAPENILFPDPVHPETITKLVDSMDGADLCWAGMGITGHVAFNDPPKMEAGAEDSLEAFRHCKTRKLTISPMSTAQMAMGGTDGNLDILPRRAVTIGMHELLKSKKFHFTFMRKWHSGLWRKALFGPVTQDFPGSLLQTHRNLHMTLTSLAAATPMVNTAQATGEEQ